MLGRTTNDYGKSPEELQEILERHQSVIDKYRDTGAIMIGAGQPQDQIIRQILEHSAM